MDPVPTWINGLSESQIASADQAKIEYKEIMQDMSVRVGHLLLKMKAILPHGNFEAWYSQELKVKQQDASICMNAAQFYKEQVAKDRNSVVWLDKTKASAMAMAQTLQPPEVKEQLLAEAAEVGKLTTTAVKKVRALKVVPKVSQDWLTPAMELIASNLPKDSSPVEVAQDLIQAICKAAGCNETQIARAVEAVTYDTGVAYAKAKDVLAKYKAKYA